MQASENQKAKGKIYPDAKGATIVMAGGTGDLGGRIVRLLRDQGASVRVLVRPGTAENKIAGLRALGAEIVEVDFNQGPALAAACAGGACVVSALSGLEEVIVDTQTKLLTAAVAAGVPRFIPSDFAIDFTKIPYGTNRNLDLRKQFKERLDKAPIAATSIFNGMFMDLLTGDAPLVLFPVKRILFWGNADQPMDFTTVENTARYTAAAAMDPDTPRYLRIAGDTLSPRGLQKAATAATGKKFGLLRMGGLGVLSIMITVTRKVAPGNKEVFPPWQGMQYLRNMLSGQAKLEPLDNDRYPDIKWTPVRQVLAAA